jgi:hypothetical protein
MHTLTEAMYVGASKLLVHLRARASAVCLQLDLVIAS